MNKLTIFGCLVLLLIGCKERVVVDAPAILRHSPEEVTAILGQPDSTYSERTLSGEAFVQHFRMYDVDVQYIDNKASYITVKGPHMLKFEEKSLASFNIDADGAPSEKEENKHIRWTKLQPPVEAVSFVATHFDSLQTVKNFTVTIIGRK